MYISSLLKAKDDTIWVGTWYDGLHSYDGKMWTKQLREMQFTALLESKDGKIWARTADGLYSYDGTMWQKHLSGMYIYSLLESKDGKIWARTADGLYSYDGTMWQKHLSGMWIYSLLESKDGKIWAGTWNGLYSYDGTMWQERLSGMSISSLLESKDGKIWAGTILNGLHSYDGTKWQEHLSGMYLTSLLESKDGTIWTGTFGNGLHSYDGTKWQEHLSGMRIHSLLESKDSKIWAGGIGLHSYDRTTWQKHLSEWPIQSLLESKDGKIWAGGIGLRSYDGTTWQEHLSGMSISSLLESKDGKIWAGTFWNGLYSYDGTTWQEHLSGMGIHLLLESKDGKIWAGMWEKGLYSYDGTTWQEHLSEWQIQSLLESKDGKIWAGGIGLHSYDGTTWQEHLSGMWVASLLEAKLEAKDGTIWAGGSGLSSYDGTTWQERLSGMGIHLLLESKDGKIWAGGLGLHSYDGIKWQEHLSGMSISSLLESKDSKIWAVTEFNGALRYDGTTWQELTFLDGLPSDNILSILEDSDGNLWFGTFVGIGVYKPNKNPPLIELTNPKEQVVETGAAAIFIEWRGGDVENETRRLTYHYKIDEGAWSKPTPANFMTTPPMSDGEHIFYVRAIDRDFNYSKPDTLTIRVDTIRPNVLIGSPVPNAIVGGKVKITGGVTDSDLSEFKVEYAAGEKPSEGDFKLISKSNKVVASGVLAEWNTKLLSEQLYTIKLSAIDKLEHTKDYSITVTLDNTPPIAKLTAPQDGSRLTKRTEIIGEVSDEHLDSYVLEYTTEKDPNIALWRQIFKTPKSLTVTKEIINYRWEIPTITGNIFIRLTAIDAAGNTEQQVISVEVPQALTKDKGGNTSSKDGDARIYIPPRSLPNDTIITINRVSEEELKAHEGWEAAYDFEPFDLQFNQKPYKPATIMLKYPAHLPESGKTLAIYRFQKKEEPVGSGVQPPNNGDGTVKWVSAERLGGTLDRSKQTITSATTHLGRFVVMQETAPTLGGEAKITELTCQPRIFSPKGGGFDTRTAISFNLGKNASVTIKIYNRAGKLTRLLKENKEMSQGVNVVFWDGRDDEEYIVASDLYIVTITAGEVTVTKTVAVSNR
jgi:ligand-binding sensor domain-containing protein